MAENTGKISRMLLLAVLTAVVSGLLLIYSLSAKYARIANSPTQITPESEVKPVDSSSVPTQTGSNSIEPAEVVASNLRIPWEIAFLPDGRMITTERPGKLRISGDPDEDIEIENVEAIGEGGLLGLVFHPDYPNTNFLYLYKTTRANGRLENRVERYRFDGASISDRQIIVDSIPAAGNHNGGRIAFGPDGKLYISTGDAGDSRSAQDTNSLAGKILRLNSDGSVPEDNPFGNAVWSYGHRNPQGLVWDGQGRLWAAEHGRSGLLSGFDEINRIEKGQNYGWPDIEGDEKRAGMIAPAVHSGSNTTWAPSGIGYQDGHLYFAGLRGQSIYKTEIRPDGTLGPVTAFFREEYGRLRAVTVREGFLYVSTSNQDGRGRPEANDDRIIKIDIDQLK